MLIIPKKSNPNKPELIAVLHVNLNNALLNTVYSERMGVETYRLSDLEELIDIRKKMCLLHKEVVDKYGDGILINSISSIFLLKDSETKKIEERLIAMPFVKALTDRAIKEVSIYLANGVKIIEIENVGTPYFLSGDIPLEELAIFHLILRTIRQKFPEAVLGINLLVGAELESLPMAISVGAFFVQSDSSVFSGLRPEGRLINKGGLAKLYYLRNFLNSLVGVSDPHLRIYPQIWTDLHKKYTLFGNELKVLSSWLNTVSFSKLEGIILTTSSNNGNIPINSLIKAREMINSIEQKTLENFGKGINIPIITGSGFDEETYLKYADYVILGGLLKVNKYWENPVDDILVKKMLKFFK